MSNQQDTNQSVHGGENPEERVNQQGANNQILLGRVDALTELVAKLSTQLEEMKRSSHVSTEEENQQEMSTIVEKRAIGRLQLRSMAGGKGNTSGGSSCQSGPLISLTI
jgi:predicted RNase H-like nuclease (RuvC/YqgF family)